jgi:glutathione S-transferase
MKIYGVPLSPFTRMCLVTAHEVGLKGKLTLAHAEVKPTEVNETLAALSPIGKIPVLETDHGHAIHDSRVIMEYLAHHAGASWFIPDDGVKRFRILTLLALAQGTADAAVALRYEMAVRPPDKNWPLYQARLEARVVAGLDEIETTGQEALQGVTAASVAVACLLAYVDVRHDRLQWRKLRPSMAAFEKEFAQRPSMLDWPVT